MVLLAAFDALLARYTGQDDLVVGAPIANRNRLETEGLIGFFTNTLALRLDLAGDPAFRELARRARAAALAAYAHQDLPFERLVEELAPEPRARAQPDLPGDAGAQRRAAPPALELPGLAVELVEVEPADAKFDLTLFLAEERRQASPATWSTAATSSIRRPSTACWATSASCSPGPSAAPETPPLRAAPAHRGRARSSSSPGRTAAAAAAASRAGARAGRRAGGAPAGGRGGGRRRARA